MAIKVIGFDTAKHVFQVHGADASGRTVLRKRLRRGQVADFFRSLPSCVVGLEATRGAHYWARVISSLGHEVRLISPQFVKPYVKGQKNDAQDAAAICEAVSRPEMRFVPLKSVEQQDLQALHRIRSRLIGCRTQLWNQIRGLLAEYGIILPLHLSQVRLQLPQLIAQEHPQLTPFSRELFLSLYEELCALDRRIQATEQRIQRVFEEQEACQRIAAVEGVGPMIATAVVAAIANGRAFRNGRQFAAWIGLVPRQHSSGDKQRLGGISKRGDPYLRMLLIHGARSVVYRAGAKADARSRWIADKQRRLGTTKACVAVANKNARIIWALNQLSLTGYTGRCFDQTEFSDSEAIHALKSGQPLQLTGRGYPVKDYNYRNRRKTAEYVKPLQVMFVRP